MERYVIGLMSGTSADGVDAALVAIEGCGERTRARLVDSVSTVYPKPLREKLLTLAGGEPAAARDFCLINRLLGERFADVCEQLCEKAGVPKSKIALVGSHGHTFWHVPRAEEYVDGCYTATLQLGDPSPINERLGCAVVSDFRVRDMAAGGQGAPLVPYTDWLLYRDPERNVALQNIGGIANVSLLGAGCGVDDIVGFDCGPGNMVMDALAPRTDPALRYDRGGRIAASGRVCRALLEELLDDPYYGAVPPKSTGREKYGREWMERLIARAGAYGLSEADLMATAAELTVETIAIACERFSPFGLPDRMIVSGGGARNPHIMRRLRERLAGTEVRVPEDLGWDSDMKEAVAFAVLANECDMGHTNTACHSTGARHAVIMGRISR